MINNQTNNRADLNSAVALGQALQRLEKNEDFLAVIKDKIALNRSEDKSL